ncbi:MAG: serine/threonine protein kinase [Gemmataceae bacterium]|nr:serine/threonine protein kinase [Gemmataceae bacterium]
MAVSTDTFLDALRAVAILPATQLDDAIRQQAESGGTRALAQHLLQRGWLTPFQVNQLMLGRGGDLLVGPYLLLERLGEGGMGQVFKARHGSLNRVVALKVLRPELVADSETVSRFYREIEVAGHLPEHPNLIRAFDAGPVGATHFLAMEYVAGTDLERLVKQSGPLSIEHACEYVRQAALGLQHAHQHGLVHRDIKPSNLLVTQVQGSRFKVPGSKQANFEPETSNWKVVKIVDLGLARLHGDNKTRARENTFLTSDGTVTLGTVDYQAPEQALDFHRADIRADIYSLGCTFFYLLTGKPPFGSGPLAVKLMRHQQAEPPSLKERRPDVPDGLVAIVGRMLAKNPNARYQTPSQVAEALATLNQPRRPSRRPILLAAAAGAVLLLLSVPLFLLLRPSGSVPERGAVAVAETKPLPPPAPDSPEATVPEARDYQLVYDLNLARLAHQIVYDQDRQAKITRPFDRIAYFIELRRNEGEAQYLYVSMDAFTTDAKKIGVPTIASGATFQMNVANMNVYSNVSGIVTGTGITGGNIEFWPNNYGPANAKNVPNADSGKYDFGDQMAGPQDGHGCMQVHNHDAKQTLFAINKWKAGNKAEIGIGNNPNGNPDWTFTGNADTYRVKRLRVLVRGK